MTNKQGKIGLLSHNVGWKAELCSLTKFRSDDLLKCRQNVGELEETLKRLQNHKGVTGVIVIDGKVLLRPDFCQKS